MDIQISQPTAGRSAGRSAFRSSAIWLPVMAALAMGGLSRSARADDQGVTSSATSAAATVTTTAPAVSVQTLEADRGQIQQIRQSTTDPIEQVARMDAWLAAHPEVRTAVVSSGTGARTYGSLLRPAPAGASPRQKLLFAALANRPMNLDPTVQVAATDQFLSQNAASLAAVAPAVPTAADLQAANQKVSARIKSLLAAKPDDIDLQLLDALQEIHTAGYTPEQIIQQTDELVRLNQAAIEQAEAQKAAARPTSATPHP